MECIYILGICFIVAFVFFIEKGSATANIIRANKTKKYTSFQDDLTKYRNKQK